MPPLILHHYALSPFSEKIRVMLGYSGLPWQSVETREMPPRPLLAPLTGGYRRIPVAQSGADIFCDTRTITEEIATLANNPTLALSGVSPEQQDFVRTTDLEVFLACVISTLGPGFDRRAARHLSLMDTLKLMWDRLKMGRNARVPRITPGKARPRIQEHAQLLETRLASSAFLFGTAPTISDFSAYHGLWFIRDVARRPYLQDFPKLLDWMDRIAAFGQDNFEALPAEDALVIARDTKPRSLPAHSSDHPMIGQPVTVTPDDYGQVPVGGVLVGATSTRWILHLNGPQTGDIHVHFPQQGFRITP